MIASKEPVADRKDTAKRFNLLEITFNDDDSVKSYIVNQKKLDTMLLTTGFFASKTIGFAIPDGCAPVYVSKAKTITRKRGRPAKPKVENQEL